MGAIRNLAKRVLFSVLEPASRVYLSKERKYTYKGIRVFVPPTVFHPAFYLSTPILLAQLEQLDVQGLQFCELGAGSGIVSLLAASKGASVTALEINPVAVDAIRRSADHNDLTLRVFRSDLFSALESETFDFLVVNPPYYPKTPESDKDRAFFCGTDFEFFQAFFSQLQQYLNDHATVWMILSEDCDLERIQSIAADHNWQMEVDYQVRKYREWHYIFKVFN